MKYAIILLPRTFTGVRKDTLKEAKETVAELQIPPIRASKWFRQVERYTADSNEVPKVFYYNEDADYCIQQVSDTETKIGK